jgi:hypothetical protein
MIDIIDLLRFICCSSFSFPIIEALCPIMLIISLWSPAANEAVDLVYL